MLLLLPFLLFLFVLLVLLFALLLPFLLFLFLLLVLLFASVTSLPSVSFIALVLLFASVTSVPSVFLLDSGASSAVFASLHRDNTKDYAMVTQSRMSEFYTLSSRTGSALVWHSEGRRF